MEVKEQSFLTNLQKILTPGQIKKIENPLSKKILWTSEDISAAISLRSVSPKAYRYLRNHNYPLPGLSTLRTWASSFDVKQGTLENVISLIKTKGEDMPFKGKLCVLSFDEMYVSNRVDIEKKSQQKIGPHRSCQTVMIRGLIDNWKQPVYYAFDQPMTKLILIEIITKIYEAGFMVVAIVSDMGSTNIALWKELNIGYDKCSHFDHPNDHLCKTFVFADVPHLLKLIRNHLLDHGFSKNREIINKTCFEKLLFISTSELTIVPKISKYHLELKRSERQKVRPAVQLLSSTVAKAIEYCAIHSSCMPASWELVSNFVQLINDWFDLFNSKSKFGSEPKKNAYGVKTKGTFRKCV